MTMRHWPLLLVWCVVVVSAYQTGRDIFFRLSYLILVILLFSFFWALYSVMTFRLKRELVTPRTEVGRVAEERFLVQNSGGLTKIWIEVLDQSELPQHQVSRVLNSLRARSRWSWSVRTLCRRRGRFHLGPITIAAGDPFGIFRFFRRLPDTTVVITVQPATVDLVRFALPMGQLSGGDALRRKTHHTTTNVIGTREYAPGDSFNRIHWRSTARMERLIVKEFELDPAADVWIFLDLERRAQVGQWWQDTWDSRDLSQLWFSQQALRLPPNTEEYGVTIAASVARYFTLRQRTVGFVCYGDRREVLQPDRGERQLSRMLQVLAVLRGEGSMAFNNVLGIESGGLGRNVTLVAISPSADVEWVKSAREAKRRGLRTIAVVVEPQSFGGPVSGEVAAAELIASGIPTYLVREGDDLRQALS